MSASTGDVHGQARHHGDGGIDRGGEAFAVAIEQREEDGVLVREVVVDGSAMAAPAATAIAVCSRLRIHAPTRSSAAASSSASRRSVARACTRSRRCFARGRPAAWMEQVPAMPLWLLPIAGLGFALVNAALEEALFRRSGGLLAPWLAHGRNASHAWMKRKRTG